MNFKFVVLWTDALIYLLVLVTFCYVLWVRSQEHLRAPWKQLVRNRLGVVSAVILSFFVIIALLDSVHVQFELEPTSTSNSASSAEHYSPGAFSLLDLALNPLGKFYEESYSSPFATELFVKKYLITQDGKKIGAYPKLKYAELNNFVLVENSKSLIASHAVPGILSALLTCLSLFVLITMFIAWRSKQSVWSLTKKIILGDTSTAWRSFYITLFCLLLVTFVCFSLSRYYHILGTDKVGQDIFFQTIKSVRTGLIIGTLTTLVMLPFAIFFGCIAGFFGGLVDDIIQFIYTTLSSVPGVLLIAASVLSMQIMIAKHADYFTTISSRADMRLLALCVILGVTSWTGLCRILRGETLKLREMDYIAAAKALGTSPLKTIRSHIIPNVMHIIVISVVLDFSGLVLAEAVLSYVGVGVDPTMQSWGNMINASRLELSRDPVVWWPLFSAFILMFILVLSANLFSDAIRDAFDPKMRKL